MSFETLRLIIFSIPVWTWLVLIPAVTLLLRRIRSQHEGFKKPPSPPKLPIIGNLHQLGTLLHRSLAELAENYGPIMLLHLGNKPTIIISTAAAAKDALKAHDADFSSRPLTFCAAKLTYNYSDMSFTPYGEYWKQMRKITTTELFSLKKVQSFSSVRVAEVNVMLESLADSATKGEAVNLSEKVFSFTASVMCKTAFDTTFNGSVMDDDKGIEKLIHEVEGLMGTFAAADYFPYIGLLVDKIFGLHSRLNRTFNKLDQFSQQLIEEHMKSEKGKDVHEDIVDGLLRVQREHIQSGATWFTMNNIKGVLLNIFIGGVGSVSLTMVWTMTELIKNPNSMKKAQDEIRCLMDGKDRVSEHDIKSLKYLKMVLMETLRLHPPIPLLPRETTSNTQVLGYHIKAGTQVYINAWAIGRDPKTWEQPEKFWPERFEDRPVDYNGQNFELLPFGGGRRMCPGLNMAMSIVELTIANMLHCFDWKLPHGMTREDISMEEGAGLTAFKKIPLKLVPIRYHT